MWSGESVEPPEEPYMFPQPFHTISTAAATEKAASTVNSTQSPLSHVLQSNSSTTPRPESTPLVDSGDLSWHCRSCLKNPCEDPTATMCGHIFCHGCIIKELATHMHCPACKKVMLLRLDVNS
ncbi:uncharacterized protein LAESUDRAFT_91137 [Laetiporus sulphureus 93-53]|uniref:RING-type domain-containing protein n=1 Tax=Laetiporus sulphureus 93-53 TaxID=1314785 RepID=A0A165EYH3_9APHY|nr:uncharacterized protein LAESUDRAFT_91137 [Laetiporus sulphureus 93-53]KZT07982.1 hypothetical protein LAESUDRAFT_91137 [Laetiporus sulphureus 93-53]